MSLPLTRYGQTLGKKGADTVRLMADTIGTEEDHQHAGMQHTRQGQALKSQGHTLQR